MAVDGRASDAELGGDLGDGVATLAIGADLGVYDVNDPAAGWSGLWDPTVDTHEIYMNDAFLAGYDPPTRQAVMEHEFGHALRLGHRNDPAALMHCYDNERVPIAPAPSDIAQYRSYWG